MTLPRLAAWLLIGCSLSTCDRAPEQVDIPFLPQYGEQTLTCNGGDNIVALTDLRFYIQDVQFVNERGDVVDVLLDGDELWQQSGLALLDFEDNSGTCQNGTVEINTALRGSIARGDYRALRFTLGVPFELNHADPLTAAAPLGDPAMHWHWRAGYKFLRAGIRSADDGFWIHLGSTGCEGTTQNITNCRSPNRTTIVLDDFVPGRDSVVIDLSKLVDGIDLYDTLPTDCSSGPAETQCDRAFNALGLDFASGTPVHEQRVFRKQDVY